MATSRQMASTRQKQFEANQRFRSADENLWDRSDAATVTAPYASSRGVPRCLRLIHDRVVNSRPLQPNSEGVGKTCTTQISAKHLLIKSLWIIVIFALQGRA